jgi:hypothetical protein
MHAWLNANCGADRWVMTAAGFRGVVNDAVAIYFMDTALANAFVVRWCIGYRVEPNNGNHQMREDAPLQRKPAGHHKTP